MISLISFLLKNLTDIFHASQVVKNIVVLLFMHPYILHRVDKELVLKLLQKQSTT